MLFVVCNRTTAGYQVIEGDPKTTAGYARSLGGRLPAGYVDYPTAGWVNGHRQTTAAAR